jgi:hypothetical protein
MLWPPQLERHQAFAAELRSALGDEAFDAAYERDRSRDVADVQEAAMRLMRGA